MTDQENLLKKYYNGETSLEEEKILKEQVLLKDSDSSEKDMFGYFEHESYVPDDLEESIFAKVTEKETSGKLIRMRLCRITSAAAVILVILSVYLGYQKNRNEKLESEFFVMEQALYQVSESLQPDEQEDMMVLWVDNNVEIIIN